MSPVVTFIIVAILAALLLWFLGSIPTLDQSIVRFIRIAILVVLTIMLLNVVLVLLFGQGIAFYLSGLGTGVRAR